MPTAAAANQTTSSTAAPEVRLPGMLVIGAMKASTTAFVELLSRHPGVWFSPVKEPHYFTASDYGEPAALGRYAALFADAPDGAILAEASTGYSKLPDLGPTPQRIRETLGEPKLIYLVRDPVARIVSNYHHSHLAGHYPPGETLRWVIDADPIVVTASRYAQQIEAYEQEFGAGSVLILTTDELLANPAAAMRRVETHLGLPAYDEWPELMPKRNARGDLGGTLVAQRLAPSGVVALAKRLLPSGLKSRVKSWLSPADAAPPTDEEIAYAQSLIEDDLARLADRLGDAIAGWPSVHRMRDRVGGAG